MVERKKNKAKFPFLTLTFILVNITVFLLILYYFDTKQIFKAYAFSKDFFLKGNYHSIFTSAFLHSSFSHLFWNMLFLFFFGRVVEDRFGRAYFLLAYFFSMILGNVFFAAFFPDAVAVGASGAVFGLMGAAMLVEPFRSIMKYVPIPLALIGAVYLYGEASNAFNLKEGVAHIAHVGGILGGFLLAFIKEKERSKRGIYAVILFLIMAIAIGLL